MTAELPSRLPVALVLGALTSVAVAFGSGCIYPVVMGRDPHTGALGWPTSGGDAAAMLIMGGAFAMLATPVAAIVGFAVALPVFRYWARPREAPAWRLLAAALALSAAAGVVTWGLYRRDEFDLPFAIVTAVVSGPLCALVVWIAARRPDVPAPSSNRWKGL